MPLTDIETRICRLVVRRFLDKHEATPRSDLLSAFRASLFVPLQNLKSHFVLTTPAQFSGDESFLPRAVTIHYSRDPEALSLARRSTELVLKATRVLFDRQLDTGKKEPLTPQDVFGEAQKTDPNVQQDMIWVGLYLAQEFSVFSMTQPEANQLGIAAFRPTEHIYDVVNTGDFWDKHIQEGIESVVRGWRSAQLNPSQNTIEVEELQQTGIEPQASSDEKSKTVFVIHGRDERLRAGVFAFLRALHLEPLEWIKAIQLTGKASPYIGEILDTAFKKAQAVVVLLSPDDEARLHVSLLRSDDPHSETELTGQARPNVLFEAGMAFGSHSGRTVLVQFGQVKPFSDIAGRHIVRMDSSVAKRQEFAAKLKAAGCAPDTDGTDWHTAGDLTVPAYPLQRLSSRGRLAKDAKTPRKSVKSRP